MDCCRYRPRGCRPRVSASDPLLTSSGVLSGGLIIIIIINSVPGISIRLAFKGVTDNFHLFSKRHSDLVKLFLAQNVGGPALIFDRFQEVGATTIGHGKDSPLTQKVLGLGKIYY